MCLSIVVDDPSRLLAEGVHFGFEYMVTHNDNDYRCGYLKVEPGHPWHSLDYDSVTTVDGDRPEIHGGLTFAEQDKPCGKGSEDSGWWFGFDCAHYMDARDSLLSINENLRISLSQFDGIGDSGGHVWTTEDVVGECKRLAKQARAVRDRNYAPYGEGGPGSDSYFSMRD